MSKNEKWPDHNLPRKIFAVILLVVIAAFISGMAIGCAYVPKYPTIKKTNLGNSVGQSGIRIYFLQCKDGPTSWSGHGVTSWESVVKELDPDFYCKFHKGQEKLWFYGHDDEYGQMFMNEDWE